MLWLSQIGKGVLALVAFGIIFQLASNAVSDTLHPAPGKRIDIGSTKLHLHATGEGGLTVVLDAGMGGSSLGWALVQPEVSKYARVCSYDRAGYAWSEESPSDRTSRTIAEELHALLHKANLPGPYLLVGHSFGGSNVLLFAHLYPDETAGVILVDSVHEEMLAGAPEQSATPPLWHHPYVQAILSFVGYNRCIGPSKEIEAMFKPLPEKIRNAYVAQMNKPRYKRTVAREMACLRESLSQLKNANISIGDKPLIVISAGKGVETAEGKAWSLMQKRLVLKSNCSKQIIASESDHMINHHQPQVIIDSILEMLNH